VIFNSERFGRIEYSEKDVIRLPQGLVGFPDMTCFFFHRDEQVSPLVWLHSQDDPNLAFLLADPFEFIPGYSLRMHLPKSMRREMGTEEDLRVLAIVTIQPDFSQSTLNLLGPLIVNKVTQNGWQVILEDDTLSTRHPLFAAAVAREAARAI
jgi:flagellar assembly factor FliW